MRKSALVAGGAGFIGRHTAHELERLGWNVLTVDVLPFDVPLFPTGADGTTQFPTTSRLHVVRDLRDFIQRSESLTFNQRFDLVVHCAYHVGGRASIDATNDHFTRNVELDAALFAWAIRTRQPHVLYFSSSAIYPVQYQTEEHVTSTQTPHLHEDDQMPRDDREPDCDADYGWAKYVGELLAQNAIENGVNVTVVRPFSGYGSDQSTDYPFPAFVHRALDRANPFTVWGNARQVRDWIHVDDVVRGSLAIVERDRQEPLTTLGRTRPVNVCSGDGVAMDYLARLICERVGYTPELIVNESAPMGVFYRVGDPTQFHQIYAPRVTLAEGIERALKEARS